MTDYSINKIRRILVVGNEAEISPLISIMLNSETVRVDTVEDGEMAEKMLQERDYALCIIDLGTLMAKDKQLYQYMNEKYPNLLNGAIFTAGGVVVEDANVFMAQIDRQFLHKPFALDRLKEMVLNTIKYTNAF
jgi:DNA-binding NtrC family response regulator